MRGTVPPLPMRLHSVVLSLSTWAVVPLPSTPVGSMRFVPSVVLTFMTIFLEDGSWKECVVLSDVSWSHTRTSLFKNKSLFRCLAVLWALMASSGLQESVSKVDCIWRRWRFMSWFRVRYNIWVCKNRWKTLLCAGFDSTSLWYQSEISFSVLYFLIFMV
jgi:hypothetical protein